MLVDKDVIIPGREEMENEAYVGKTMVCVCVCNYSEFVSGVICYVSSLLNLDMKIIVRCLEHQQPSLSFNLE